MGLVMKSEIEISDQTRASITETGIALINGELSFELISHKEDEVSYS